MIGENPPGSIAAAIQGPAVASGSLFAVCQSIGATGAVPALWTLLGGVVGGAAAAGAAAAGDDGPAAAGAAIAENDGPADDEHGAEGNDNPHGG
jgi:hypothetical protein